MSYDAGNVDFSGTGDQRRNALRLVLQDNKAREVFADGELDAILADSPNVWRAAIAATAIKIGSVKTEVLGRKRVDYWQSQQPVWAANARRGNRGFAVQVDHTCAFTDLRNGDSDSQGC